MPNDEIKIRTDLKGDDAVELDAKIISLENNRRNEKFYKDSKEADIEWIFEKRPELLVAPIGEKIQIRGNTRFIVSNLGSRKSLDQLLIKQYVIDFIHENGEFPPGLKIVEDAEVMTVADRNFKFADFRVMSPYGKPTIRCGEIPDAEFLESGEGWVRKRDLKNKWADQDGLCKGCGKSFPLSYAWHADHIDPKAKTGHDSYINIQLLCYECHVEKSRIDNSI